VERDCSLGERIIYTQPMPVHIKKTGKTPLEDYKVLSVMITNQGVYLIDDEEESW